MKNSILLPELKAEFNYDLPKKELLLIGGGRAPAKAWLQSISKGKTVWCIDHGLDCCRQADILPQRLIGDGDSAAQENWQWAAEQNIPIAQFPPEKDFTDTQLALQMAAEEQSTVILSGAMGGRFDHAYSTILSFAHSGLPGCIADELETIFFLREGEKLQLHFAKEPKAVSLLPMTAQVTDVKLTGVHWPLNNALLEQHLPYAVSNRLAGKKITLSIGQGILGIYICWNE